MKLTRPPNTLGFLSPSRKAYRARMPSFFLAVRSLGSSLCICLDFRCIMLLYPVLRRAGGWGLGKIIFLDVCSSDFGML